MDRRSALKNLLVLPIAGYVYLQGLNPFEDIDKPKPQFPLDVLLIMDMQRNFVSQLSPKDYLETTRSVTGLMRSAYKTGIPTVVVQYINTDANYNCGIREIYGKIIEPISSLAQKTDALIYEKCSSDDVTWTYDGKAKTGSDFLSVLKDRLGVNLGSGGNYAIAGINSSGCVLSSSISIHKMTGATPVVFLDALADDALIMSNIGKENWPDTSESVTQHRQLGKVYDHWWEFFGLNQRQAEKIMSSDKIPPQPTDNYCEQIFDVYLKYNEPVRE
jgi:isochorismate hydrolase